MDLYFIHCPAFYDFRKDFNISGSGVAGVPTTSIFEMHPIGLISLTDTLQKHHYKVQIVNLALKMLKKKKFNLIKYIKKLKSDIYAFDLHWMIHAQGSIKIAELFKKYHPTSKIVFGGLTASYFYKELLKNYEFIDFIIRGDSAEYPLLRLVNNITFRCNFESIPNLVWRDGKRIRINDFSHVPNYIEYNGINFPKIYFRMFLDSKDIDPYSYLPTLYFLKKPVIPILFSKGCIYNCINCGGSQFASKLINNRNSIAKKPPKVVAQELINISQSFNFPIRIIGDLRICGRRYCDKLFEYLGNHRIDNPTTFEFFTPANKYYIEKISKHFNRVSIEISPESGNQEVRMFQGRPFSNKAIFDMIKKLNLLNEYIFIMWFQVGNALDSENSLKETIKFSKDAIKMDRNNIYPFISPLAPYIDPGSLAFEFPEKYGYKITRSNLRKQIEGFKRPIWKYYLNYETKNFNPEDIIKLSYKYVKLLEDIKYNYKLLSTEAYHESIQLLNFLERLTFAVDKIWLNKGREETNIFLERMNFDKTGLNVKSTLTQVLFPQLSLYDFYKNFIKFSAISLKNKLKKM